VLEIDKQGLKNVLAHFGRSMPVLFLYTSPRVGIQVRKLLGMNVKGQEPYYDPLSDDETHKRITLLPEKMPEDAKTIIKQIYTTVSKEQKDLKDLDELKDPKKSKEMLIELECKEANAILVKASPKEVSFTCTCKIHCLFETQ
jgi:sentrin-specific protease 7